MLIKVGKNPNPSNPEAPALYAWQDGPDPNALYAWDFGSDVSVSEVVALLVGCIIDNGRMPLPPAGIVFDLELTDPPAWLLQLNDWR